MPETADKSVCRSQRQAPPDMAWTFGLLSTWKDSAPRDTADGSESTSDDI